MKKYFLFAIISVLFNLTYCNAQPKLTLVKGNEINWNKVSPKDSPLKAKVVIKNEGNEKLIISNVKPSCGCTHAPLSKNELNPGDTASMDVSMTISPRAGFIEKSITITSNDKEHPIKELKLKAEVYLAMQVDPTGYFAFGEMKVGQEITAMVKIKNAWTQPVVLSDFTIEPSNLTLNVMGKKTLKPGEELELIAKVTPTKKGYFNSTVKFKTTCPDFPEIVVPGYGTALESAIFKSE
ncbi:MAG: DUF1573 domain-containing protein [Bacteroidota bacterium]